ELPPGKVRVKTGGGNAGHNGLRSITAHIGNDYRRVRIGVGHPGVKELVEMHVLSDFAKSEREWVEALRAIIADNAALLAKGEVAVPDPRLERLAVLAKSAKIVPTRLTFVDIAGLVRGASRGEGLGNQFLARIREVDAIAHVVRCFEDPDVTHVENRIDPIAD